MAFTAWETYVEDRVREALDIRLAAEGDGPSARFVQRRFEEELKKFNNPNSDKTKKLFVDFLGIDALIAKRGEAVHRSSPKRDGPPPPHLITKVELEKAINFLKSLVEATEKTL